MSKITKESKSILLKKILDSGMLSFCFAIMVLIVMPLYIWLVPPFMILWGISWIIENRKLKLNFDKEHRQQNRLLILFVAFYLWQLIGILYSNDVKTGLSAVNATNGVHCYPNPVVNKLTVSAKSEISQFSIHNLLGQSVKSAFINGLEKTIDVSDVASGNYLITIKLANGQLSTQKIVKL